MSITHWPEEQRPREKLLKLGVHSLNDAELLAIFLRVGTKGKSAVDLGYDMLNKFSSLYNLCHANLEDFSSLKGLGLAKYCQLQACLEMAKRVLKNNIDHNILHNAEQLHNYLKLYFQGLHNEQLIGVFLGTKNQILATEILSNGSIDSLPIYTRNIVKIALNNNARYLILSHNHPHGTLKASNTDIETTLKIQKTLEHIEVELLDHILIANNNSYSMRQHGLI